VSLLKTQTVTSLLVNVQVSKQFNVRTHRTGAAKMSRSIDAITVAYDIQVLLGGSGRSTEHHTL